MDDGVSEIAARPRVTLRRVLLAGAAIVVVAIVGAWLVRKPIADSAIRDALAKRGVEASYDLKSIGARWQRIEHVRLGDPRNPAVTADWVEVRLTGGVAGISATDIRAGGVRLHGRITDGRLSFGTVDRLLPKSDGKTLFSLPDLTIDLADSRMRLDTPFGPIGAKLEGRGNLRDGFAGKLAAIAPVLRHGACTAKGMTAYVDIRIADGKPGLTGPVRAQSATCQDYAVVAPAAALDVTASETLDRFRGTANIEAARFDRGAAQLALIAGTIGFDGGLKDMRGTADLSAQAGRYGAHRLSGMTASGGFLVKNGVNADGKVQIERFTPDPALAKQIASGMRATAGTPIAPLGRQLATAIDGASEGLSIAGDLKFAENTLTISRLVATGRDRLAFRAEGGEGIRLGSAGLSLDMRAQLSGGGFPSIDANFKRRTDGITLGLARIAPMAAQGSRLAFEPVRFAAKPSGAMRFETTVTLNGPLSGGRIEGLRLPVFADWAANGALTVNSGCVPVGLRSVAISGLTLGEAALRLCPAGGAAMFSLRDGRVSGGVSADGAHLAGRIGTTPVTLTARRATYGLGANAVRADDVSAVLGTGARISKMRISTLAGAVRDGAMRGTFAGLSGKIAAVPLLVDKAAGNWSLQGGGLALKGGLTVSDEPVPVRFKPLMSDDVALKLAAGKIAATATLRQPDKRTEVVRVTVNHDLRTSTGSATLDVPGISFGKGLQPEELTRLTLGIVANVEGSVTGRGDIRWSPSGVTSAGRFATDNMNLAAAFGPVTGLKGTVVFNDLLALATPPGQEATVAAINPGTLVTDGVISYQLLPGQRIAVERGYWPFAGGTLTLDPTILDMGQPSARRLTFRVTALDAAKFVQNLEFENLSASGTFDGVLPMIFDANGGRIEGGSLVARAPGGTLAYVGDVSNAQMNVFGKLAFDALKSMRFQNLTIDLNGPLDGEIVSRVNFSGRNEAPLSPPKNFIARQLVGLPFKFNVTIRAPFRSLLNTAKTLQDPTQLLKRAVPELSTPPVQPPESEKKQ